MDITTDEQVYVFNILLTVEPDRQTTKLMDARLSKLGRPTPHVKGNVTVRMSNNDLSTNQANCEGAQLRVIIVTANGNPGRLYISLVAKGPRIEGITEVILKLSLQPLRSGVDKVLLRGVEVLEVVNSGRHHCALR
jgi:hypothetical protein